MTRRVTISAGFGQTHLLPLAASLASRGELSGIIMGGALRTKRWSEEKRRPQALARLRQRTSGIPAGLVWPIWSAELQHQLAQALTRHARTLAMNPRVAAASLLDYQRAARRRLGRAAPDATVFHARSGFLGAYAAQLLEDAGTAVLIDHTIAHPSTLSSLLARPHDYQSEPVVSPFWRIVAEDLSLGVHTTVNSDFVKATCLKAGMQDKNITVIYTRPEDWWYDACRERTHPVRRRPVRLLTAGTHEWRKGSQLLLPVARRLACTHPHVNWVIAGAWSPELEESRRQLSSLPSVTLIPKVPREELPALMGACDIFILPTLAEGSARVVGEAMAAGCAIVTTPNAGSPLVDSLGGRLVPACSTGDLLDAVLALLEEDGAAAAAGAYNRRFMAERLGPGTYSSEMRQLYASLAG